MKTFLIPTLLCSVLAFSGTASAETMTGHEGKRGTKSSSFKDLDTNSDGYLSQSEVSERKDIKEKWTNLDKDGDRQLNPSEFSAFEQSEMQMQRDPATGLKSDQ